MEEIWMHPSHPVLLQFIVVCGHSSLNVPLHHFNHTEVWVGHCTTMILFLFSCSGILIWISWLCLKLLSFGTIRFKPNLSCQTDDPSYSTDALTFFPSSCCCKISPNHDYSTTILENGTFHFGHLKGHCSR